MAQSTILVGDGTRTIVTTAARASSSVTAGALAGADWVHVDHVGYRVRRRRPVRLRRPVHRRRH